ncbi:MAG: hypothetical protein A2600_13005 [Candidatus Lambdaproteobacteria bacterium RIFOXYD1_FULL_56_27]|uniref:Uncharacterized protein n=1 Tax=Candidatus Lambdaproteobacteria bacterium RIFOXYD2_FULL_56_26 TaxID=1817773 RepID=A0A1F6GL69_9PROT|nr:MAG: hypothetical protein A2557_13180 [Candidatus Lambdaproteobacteria bacterium RIFOXYD2_FULL_56_26]OGH03566.1 MAG: hypothetical protein A2426_06365 [Candidatus Lambdaproteobacteria bacterium RIFOXYC1_FULL_56_13]OGH08938.1 MAG: hypothetical protein A2600_13005 [Candidatus Lambdaproteobacteria bacterium RIFOXYD1_FULL_56_27]
MNRLFWVLVLVGTTSAARATCLICHPAVQSPASHGAVGCQACHGGSKETTKELAHQGLVRRPGELAWAGKSCGQSSCHPDQVRRVGQSLMASGSGMIELTQKTFGEPGPPPVGRLGETGAQGYLRKLCVSCHLGQGLLNPEDPVSRRGGGCLACHLGTVRQKGHFPLDKKIGSDRCFGCHSRSGRVSLTYAGFAELSPNRKKTEPGEQRLTDGRPVRLMPADRHFTAGLECIDCHTGRGLMGGPVAARHQGEQREITCLDCHDGEARPPFVARRFGTPLVKLEQTQGVRTLRLKLTGTLVRVPLLGLGHGGQEHRRLSCDACHSTWAPQCYGCHIRYLPQEKQLDHQSGQLTPGRWVETGWDFEAGLPDLGVQGERIRPFVPGMVASLELPGKPVRRWNHYAPLSPHSTGKARSCDSCHQPDPALAVPGAAARRWNGESPRKEVRALNETEQQKIKAVGLCLPCHLAPSGFYRDFGQKRQRLQRDTSLGTTHQGVDFSKALLY